MLISNRAKCLHYLWQIIISSSPRSSPALSNNHSASCQAFDKRLTDQE